MCESSVFLIRDGEKTLVMREAGRLQVSDAGVVCVSALGERVEVPGAEIADANLVKHEIVLRPRGE